MTEVIQVAQRVKTPVAQRVETPDARIGGRASSVVRTDSVNVVFTTVDETLPAVHVASALGRALGVSLTVVHFRAVPYPLSVQAPVGVSPIETDAFVERIRSDGIDVRVRVYLCRRDDHVLPTAFKPHSLIVIGGRRSWWPTAAERLRRRLERAGHFVVFVDTSEQKESSRA
jgi:hypothetical protein